MLKRIFSVLLLIPCILLSSCSHDNGKKKLLELLFSDVYSTEFGFTISRDGEEKLSGNAVAIKDKSLCISFSSPEILNGLSVISDAVGNADSYTFSYYGMKAPLPSGALTDINIIMSLFSDETALSLSSLPRSATTEHDKSSHRLDFTLCGNIKASLIYDTLSGDPVSFSAQTENGEIDLTFTKIKRQTS